MKSVAQMHYEMIEAGSHALIMKDAHSCSVQPLTRQGADGMKKMLQHYNAPAHFVESVHRKMNGLYVAAIPLENRETGPLAAELTEWVEGSVSVIETDEALPTFPLQADA